jgi:CubicO group peptidase (beta-lactamase class C family)
VEEVVTEATSVGIDPWRLQLLLDRVRADVEHGPLPSAQVAVAKDGRLVAFETYGEAAPDTRYLLHSAGRPVVAAAVWLLLGRGQLAVDERVADIVPEFGTNGKEEVTVFQVLTQTAGFPLAPMKVAAYTDRDLRLDTFARWRLTYEPGTRFEFHLGSAAWVLAEIIERRTGATIADFLADEIAGPLGLGIELGVPVERQATTVAPVLPQKGLVGDIDDSPFSPWFLRDPAIVAAGEPSHAMVASAADMVRFYQALYHSGRWDRSVVAEATSVQVEMGITGGFGTTAHVGRTGLFVMIEGPATASARTFGHSGAPSQLTWCDPEVGLSFAFLHNGYGPSGYDKTRSGASRSHVISAMAGDLLAEGGR